MEDQIFSFKSFNPYESKYPNRKVLGLSEIHIIKALKIKGFKVNILPSDLRPVDYIFRKGYADVLSLITPFIITVWQELPKEIVLSTISDWYRGVFFNGDKSKPIPNQVANNIIYIQNFNGNVYNLNGDTLTPEKVAEKLSQVKTTQEDYKQSFLQKSLYDDLPIPIYREHSSKIVGWAEMSMDDKGIHIDRSIITDKNTLDDVMSKKLRGFSTAGIATKSICNICNCSYVECEHISGKYYNDIECINSIVKALFVECSLVETPAFSECVVDIIANQNSNNS